MDQPTAQYWPDYSHDARAPAGYSGPDGARLASALLPLFAALLGFALVRQGTDHVAAAQPELIFGWCGGIAVLSTLLLAAGYGAMPVFAARALRASALFLALYALVEPFAIPYAALAPDHPAVLFHSHARWLALALALGGLFRPAPVFAAAMIIWMMRELQTGLTGFYFSTLDIRNVVEIIAFWSSGLALVAIAAQTTRLRQELGFDEAALEKAALLLFAAGVGAHLANYFWSGLAKLALDGGALSWLVGNRLYDGIPAALEKGTLPLAGFPTAITMLDTALRWLAIPVNLLAWTAQILAIAAPLRRRWLVFSVIGFDLFHLAVWFSLGLLFWKWIALNAILLAALTAIRDDQWRGAAAMVAVVFVIAGMAMFRTATLAWYESLGFASPYFVAEMKDGTRYRVPNAYFLSASYQVSQAKIWSPGGTGHFNHSIWGSVLHHADVEAGRNCAVPVRSAPVAAQFGPPEAIGRFVRAHHRQILPQLDARGRLGYYRVPHHHVPSPFLADPFYNADKRQIARYAFVVESVCLSLDAGQLRRKVLKRSEIPVYDVSGDRIMAGSEGK